MSTGCYQPYYKNGTVCDKPPQIEDGEIEKQKQKLKENGYPQQGYLRLIDTVKCREDGTYLLNDLNIEDLHSVSFTEGYYVSFQVNKAIGVHRDYTEEEYDRYVYECMSRTGSLPYLGYYGNAEISFYTKDINIALRIAVDFNQKAIYDISFGELKNDCYERKTNPAGGQS